MKGIFKKSSIGVAVLLGMFSWSTQAQYTCGNVEYNSDVLENYPELANACRDVLELNGKLYTKVLARVGYNDTFDRRSVRLVMNDGSLGPTHRIKQRPDLNVTTYEGEKIRWRDLDSNQDITVYIPNDRWAIVNIDEAEPASEMVEAEMMDEDMVEETAEVTEFAMVPVEDTLPKTASNRYLTLYSGMAALIAAGTLWMRRRWIKQS